MLKTKQRLEFLQYNLDVVLIFHHTVEFHINKRVLGSYILCNSSLMKACSVVRIK